jgi:hypothetical protein
VYLARALEELGLRVGSDLYSYGAIPNPGEVKLVPAG